MSVGEQFLVFRRIVVSSSSGQRNVRGLLRELHPKHEGNTIVRNVGGNYSPIDTALHPRRPEISGLTTHQYGITTRHDKVLQEQEKSILKKLTNDYSYSQSLRCFISSSSTGTTAHCGLWPVEQDPSIFPSVINSLHHR
jgi:hypothetical protein